VDEAIRNNQPLDSIEQSIDRQKLKGDFNVIYDDAKRTELSNNLSYSRRFWIGFGSAISGVVIMCRAVRLIPSKEATIKSS